MFNQAVFNYKALSWIFLETQRTGYIYTVFFMDGYYSAHANGLRGSFKLNELAEAIMWVETKAANMITIAK